MNKLERAVGRHYSLSKINKVMIIGDVKLVRRKLDPTIVYDIIIIPSLHKKPLPEDYSLKFHELYNAKFDLLFSRICFSIKRNSLTLNVIAPCSMEKEIIKTLSIPLTELTIEIQGLKPVLAKLAGARMKGLIRF